MIKAIFFDFDGVICDTEPVFYDFKKKKMAEMGFPVDDDFLMKRIGESFRVMFPREFKVEDPEKYIKEYYASDELNHLDYRPFMYPELIELLKYCKKHEILCAITSNSKQDRLEKVTVQLGIHDYFSALFSSDLLKVAKPNPQFYTAIATKLHLKQDEILVIEDSTHGIEAAVHAGLFTVAKKEYRFGMDQSLANRSIDLLTEVIPIIEEINK